MRQEGAGCRMRKCKSAKNDEVTCKTHHLIRYVRVRISVRLRVRVSGRDRIRLG